MKQCYVVNNTASLNSGDHSSGIVKFPESSWHSYPWCVTNFMHTLLSVLAVHYKLAATLWWFTAAPKSLKIQVFWGVTQPPGAVQPLYSRGHNYTRTYNMCPSLIQIGSKTAEKNSAQTNKQTLRKYWSLGREPIERINFLMSLLQSGGTANVHSVDAAK